MPFNYRVSKEAEADIYESYVWYEEEQAGLGEEFLQSLDAAKKAILKDPNMYGVRYKKKIRGYVVDRFPYLILYIVDEKNINVISVFHTRQHPKTWKERIK